MSSDYVKVFSGNSTEVQRIRIECKEQGIHTIIKDESESARMAGFGSVTPGQQDLYVLREQADKAMAIIQQQG